MNDLIILSLLVKGPKHGYRLKQDAALFSGTQRLHNNTVYPLLKRYQKQGWITRKEADGERGQTRLLYSLTAAGRKVLIEKLAGFSEEDAASSQAFQLRVGLFGLLGKPEREHILALRDRRLSGRIEILQQIGDSAEIDEWGATTVRFTTKQRQLERKWIGQLRTQI